VGHLKHYLTLRLKDQGVSLMTSTKVKEVGLGFAVVEDSSGTRRLTGFDGLVLALGAKPDERPLRDLQDQGVETKIIGDANQARGVMEALTEAEEAALAI